MIATASIRLRQWLASRRERRKVWLDAWELLHQVHAVLRAIPADRNGGDYATAVRLAGSLEPHRNALSAPVIDATQRIVAARRRGMAPEITAAYDAFESAVPEFRRTTGAVRRTRRRLALILAIAAAAAVLAATAASLSLRLAIAPATITGVPSTWTPLLRAVFLLGGTIVTSAAVHRIRLGYGWWIATLIGFIAVGLPVGLGTPMHGLASWLLGALAVEPSYLNELVASLPLYIIATWLSLFAVVLVADWWMSRQQPGW